MTPPVPSNGWRIIPLDLHEGGTGFQLVDGEGRCIANNQTFYPQAMELEDALFIATMINKQLGQSTWFNMDILPVLRIDPDLGEWCQKSKNVLIRTTSGNVLVGWLFQLLMDGEPDSELMWELENSDGWRIPLDKVVGWALIP